MKQVGAVILGAVRGRRRPRGSSPRRHVVLVRYSDEEYADVLALAASARQATATYVALTSLAPLAGEGPNGAVSEQTVELLVELMGVHRQLRGACTNLNQAQAKFNATGEAPGELAAVAAYVRRVANAVDGLVARLADRPDQ